MMELAFVFIQVIRSPSMTVLAALLLVIALRREIGDWIGRKFFGNPRR